MRDTLKTLRERRSIRSYKSQQISDTELNFILEAGTWAPSGMGKQSAVMVVLQDSDTIARLSAINAEIMGKPDTDPFYGAPTVVVVLANADVVTWLQDGSLVMGNLMNAAAALGVGSCWVNRARETFERADCKKLLEDWGLSESYRGVGYCILGYAEGDAPAPKERKEDYIIRP